MRNLIFGAILLPAVAVGQSINADFDVFFGSEAVGNGVPSDAFGAAADQPGRWNRLNASGGPRQLVGLDGVLTNVWLTRTGISQRGGWNNPLNSGDFRLLLNDGGDLSSKTVTWTLTGLATGHYLVFVYAVTPVPNSPPIPTEVLIPGSTSQNPQIVTGPMPGNSFQHLITHSIHDINVSNGELIMTITGDPSRSIVNGFQVVTVPEPISAACIAAGFVVLLLRRRRGNN